MNLKEKFISDADKIVLNLSHRETIKFNIGRYEQAFYKGLNNYKNLELGKKYLNFKKSQVFRNWSKYLLRFEKNAIKHGANVFWASNSDEAIQYIQKIIELDKSKLVVKTKSMVSEEIGLNEFLDSIKMEYYETDLGEFIVHLAGEKPYHILTPAMHKSRKDVSQLFSAKFAMKPDSTPEEITKFVRKFLKDKFFHADLGITGANFLVAETGSVVLTENEGNGLMTGAFPKTQIVIAGIEKIIPEMKDLNFFLPILSQHGTGQKITAYNSIFTGVNTHEKSLVIILLDNGRTELFRNVPQNRALTCIRCGACLNFCPIYKNVGGYTYNSVYSGPIGSVITPFFKGFKDYAHLSFASSLCGRCSEKCPMKIPIHSLILANRNKSVDQSISSLSERVLIHKFAKASSIFYKLPFTNLKNLIVKSIFKKSKNQKINRRKNE